MSKRSYHQYCGVARALDVLGERWTLLIVRDLLLGPRRYGDLLEALAGITTNMLAARLKHLQAHDLIEKHALPPPAGATVYRLTERGAALRDLVLELGRFGAQYLRGPAADDRIDVRWAMVSLMRRFGGSPRAWTLQLFIGELPFVADLRLDVLHMRDGTTESADVTLQGPTQAWLAWFAAHRSARDLVHEGALLREGPARPFADLSRAVGCLP